MIYKTLPILPLSPEGLSRGGDVEARLCERMGWRAGWEAWPWRVLEVQAGRELGVRDRLREAGLPAVTPMRRIRVRAHRRWKCAREKRAPMLPGYLLAGVRDADWTLVRDVREVRGVVGVEGVPARVRAAQVRAFLAQAAREADAEPTGWSGALGGGARLAVGGRAEVLRGSMAGWVVEVRALRGPMALVATQLLGGREAQIALDDLAAA